MIQVADMDYMRLQLLQDFNKAAVYPGGLVTIFETGIIDDVQSNPGIIGILFHPKAEVGRKGVFLAGEDMYLVALSESLAQRLAVDFRPGVVTHRIAVDHLENSQLDAPAVFVGLPTLRPVAYHNQPEVTGQSNSPISFYVLSGESGSLSMVYV